MGLKEKILGYPYVVAPKYCKRFGQNCDTCKTSNPMMPECVKKALNNGKDENPGFIVCGRVKR